MYNIKDREINEETYLFQFIDYGLEAISFQSFHLLISKPIVQQSVITYRIQKLPFIHPLQKDGVNDNNSSLILLSLQVSKKIIPKALASIIEPDLLIQAINLLDLLGIEPEVAFEIGADTSRRLGFGNHGVAVCYAPC